MTRRLIIALGLLIALSGCGLPDASGDSSRPSSSVDISPNQTASEDRPVERSTGDGVFELVIRSARQTWRADEPIEVEATLTYAGEAEAVVVGGSGSGLVGFSLEQLDGPLDVEGVQMANCVPYEMVRGESTNWPYKKSGGYSPNDPNDAPIKAFLQDPVFRLPAGAYVVRANFMGLLGAFDYEPDDELHELSVELPLTVGTPSTSSQSSATTAGPTTTVGMPWQEVVGRFTKSVTEANLPGTLPYSVLPEDQVAWLLGEESPIHPASITGFRFANGDLVILFDASMVVESDSTYEVRHAMSDAEKALQKMADAKYAGPNKAVQATVRDLTFGFVLVASRYFDQLWGLANAARG
jgi:hypothetical protein